MAWFKPDFWQRVFAVTLVLVVTTWLVFPFTPVAQAGNLWEDFQSLFQPPTSDAPAGRNAGGAGRGPICAVLEMNERSVDNILALVPLNPAETSDSDNNLNEPQNAATASNQSLGAGNVGGLTTEEHPTFWFYLPYTLPAENLSETSQNRPETSSKLIAQFVLLDHTNHPVRNELMAVELSDTPQLVEYSLPSSLVLVIDELYTWYFSVICDSDKLSRNPVVKGWIQRTEPTEALQTDLRNADRFEQYVAYGNNGFWFDAVNSLVKIRREFPSINRESWAALLDYFQISKDDRFNVLEPVQPIQREVVNGNQFPARIYGDQ